MTYLGNYVLELMDPPTLIFANFSSNSGISFPPNQFTVDSTGYFKIGQTFNIWKVSDGVYTVKHVSSSTDDAATTEGQ